MELLTARQEDILRLLAEGKSNRDIAAELGVSVSAAGNFVYAIYNRIGVNNRVQAARWYDEHAGAAA